MSYVDKSKLNKRKYISDDSNLEKEKSENLELSRYHGKNVGYLENEMFTLGNLVNKLTYNEKTQKFKVKLIYKYEGYGFLNKSAVDSATFTLDKKDIEYFGMLEENYKGNDFPSKKRTFYDYDKFHGFAKGLDGTNILKLFKPKESSYGDGNLKDVIVLKISDDAYWVWGFLWSESGSETTRSSAEMN